MDSEMYHHVLLDLKYSKSCRPHPIHISFFLFMPLEIHIEHFPSNIIELEGYVLISKKLGKRFPKAITNITTCTFICFVCHTRRVSSSKDVPEGDLR